jgi:hypothetical protein
MPAEVSRIDFNSAKMTPPPPTFQTQLRAMKASGEQIRGLGSLID